MQLTHAQVHELPADCQTLPPKARLMLMELLAFGRWLAVHRRYTGTKQVCFHAPQWLIAQVLGVHEDTVRRYLLRTPVRQVVRSIPHYTQGHFHPIIDGKIFAVALDPQEHPYPRIVFRAGERYRDLESDAEQGRLRGSYSPQAKSLSEALKDWVLSAGAVPQVQASVEDPRRPVDKLWEALREMYLRRTRPAVTRAAQAIVAFTHDDPRFLPGWCMALWRVLGSIDNRAYQQLIALLARHSDAPKDYLGKHLLMELKLAGA